jgi:hypothetical protein
MMDSAAAKTKSALLTSRMIAILRRVLMGGIPAQYSTSGISALGNCPGRTCSPLYNDEGGYLNAPEATGSTGRHGQERPDGPVGNLAFMAAPGAEMSSTLLVVLDAPERAQRSLRVEIEACRSPDGIIPKRPDDRQGPRPTTQGPDSIRHWLSFWMPVQRSSGHPPEFEVGPHPIRIWYLSLNSWHRGISPKLHLRSRTLRVV